MLRSAWINEKIKGNQEKRSKEREICGKKNRTNKRIWIQ